MVGYDELIKILNLLKSESDFADIFWEISQTTELVCEAGRLEKASCGQVQGIGLRLLKNGQTFYGFTNELSYNQLWDLACYLIKGPKEIVNAELPQKQPPAATAIKRPLESMSLEEKSELVKRADKTAWKQSPLIRQIKVVYRENYRHIRLFSTLNGITEETQVRLVFIVQAVAAKDNVLQTGYEPWGGSKGLELLEEKTPEQIAEVAAQRALKMLQAAPAPGGTMPVVILSQAGGTMIHEAVGHGLEADLAHEGLSVYANKIGEKVASDLVTVIDDPTLESHYGHYVYDDEGTPAQRVVLIENGILKTYLYNNEYAFKAGVLSNGHGRRQSYRHKPIPRMGNTFIAPGESSPEEIIKSVDKGLLVCRMGGGQVNTINGDFVFEAAEAYLIEKGQIAEPVRGATLVGNGPKVLSSIAMVGNDLQFGFGTCGKDAQLVPVSDGQPTILIPEIIVGGTGSF